MTGRGWVIVYSLVVEVSRGDVQVVRSVGLRASSIVGPVFAFSCSSQSRASHPLFLYRTIHSLFLVCFLLCHCLSFTGHKLLKRGQILFGSQIHKAQVVPGHLGPCA